jgi:hypothetical protein
MSDPFSSAANTLYVVTTYGDEPYAFYVNGEYESEIHCNDQHEIPGLLYRLMVNHTFEEVVEVTLTDKKVRWVEKHHDQFYYFKYLSDYSEGDFDWDRSTTHKKEDGVADDYV